MDEKNVSVVKPNEAGEIDWENSHMTFRNNGRTMRGWRERKGEEAQGREEDLTIDVEEKEAVRKSQQEPDIWTFGFNNTGEIK